MTIFTLKDCLNGIGKYQGPIYNRNTMIRETAENPSWIHVGCGNFFRACIAPLAEDLLNQGLMTKGIIGCVSHNLDVVDTVYAPYDNAYLHVQLHGDGQLSKQAIGCIADILKLNLRYSHDLLTMRKYIQSPSLQIVSFCITEKAYPSADMQRNCQTDIHQDFDTEPSHAKTLFGIITSLLYQRFINGKLPLALMSFDNFARNGDVLKNTIIEYAYAWCSKGFVPTDFIQYLRNPSLIAFPWTMVDRITPLPSNQVAQILQEDGYCNAEIIITKKCSHVASFCNTEKHWYIAMEDAFPNGRPPFEQADVRMASQHQVEQTERMKVCACLNPVHTALALSGCLLGYQRICDAIKDKDLYNFVHQLAVKELLPLVSKESLWDAKEFLSEVLNQRLPNKYLPDSPQRIACDTSLKMPIRFGTAISWHGRHGSVHMLDGIVLVIALWLRYLLRIDDEGNAMEISYDPNLECNSIIQNNGLYGIDSYDHSKLLLLLQNKALFKENLKEIGLSTKILSCLDILASNTGAVRRAIAEYAAKE